MPSILCFEKTFSKTNNTTWTAARRLGVTFLGEQLSSRLGAQDELDNFFPSVACVLKALQTANGVHEPSLGNKDYGLWVDVATDVFVPLKKIRLGDNNKIRCKLDGKLFTLTVVDDDEDDDDRKMTIAVPGDRGRVTGTAATSLYVLGVVEDIVAIRSDTTIKDPALAAARYTLGSVTFRRCA